MARLAPSLIPALGLLAAACGRTTDAPRAPSVLGDARGSWRVVGDSAPGVSAMSAAERAAWRGRDAQYTDSVARLGSVSCTAPEYVTRTASADRELSDGFRLAPGALGYAKGSTITVTEISCRKAHWNEPGATLYWISASRAYTVWDGVFFVLERR